MHKISAVGLFCCDKFEETPKQKVINMSKLNEFHFRLLDLVSMFLNKMDFRNDPERGSI